MDLTQYGLRVIKTAKKTCQIVSLSKTLIAGTNQYTDFDTVKYAEISCRYQQTPVTKSSQISQNVQIKDVTGIFYLGVSENGITHNLEAQNDLVIYEGARYEILFVEIPSMPAYIKLHVKKQ